MSGRARVWFLVGVLGGCIGHGESTTSIESAEPGTTRSEAVVPDQDPSAPSPGTKPVLPASGPIGTANPVILEAASPAGRWVVVCQARHDTDGDGQVSVGVGHHGDLYGDRIAPYLVVGDGDGRQIDAFVASSSDGRWLAFVRDKRLVLYDAARDVEQLLPGADTSDDPTPFGPHRAASMDTAGTRLAYVRKHGRRRSIVVRELETGAETEIETGRGKLWRAWIDPGGRHVWARMITRDTDGDGKLAIPQIQTSLSDRGCRGPIRSYSTGGWLGDEPETKVTAIRPGARVTATRGAIGTLGDDIVIRRPDNGIEARGPGGKRLLFEPSCGAEILHADRQRGHLFAVCEDRSVVMHDGTRVQKTGANTSKRDQDTFDAADLVRLEDARMLVSGAGKVVALDGSPLTAFDDKAAASRGKTVTVLDVSTGSKTEVELDATDDDYVYAIAIGAPYIALRHGKTTSIVDLSRSHIVATESAPVLALSTDGAALVAAATDEGYGSIPQGPLRWRALESTATRP